MATKKPLKTDQKTDEKIDQATGSTPDFERAMTELESVVERLEQGELPLEQALSHFERGVQLSGVCQAALKAAEQKVEILLKKSGVSEVSAFDAGSAEDAGDGDAGS